MIGFNQIPRGRTGRVEIGSGAEDSQSHRLHRHQNMSYGDGVFVSSLCRDIGGTKSQNGQPSAVDLTLELVTTGCKSVEKYEGRRILGCGL